MNEELGVTASSGGRAATPSGPNPQAVSGIAGIPNAEHCPGHVASPSDAKVCALCGIHIDELRPEPADAGDGA